MKEVKACRYAGPFEDVPFDNFIQSPIGLVPKAGNKTSLIFHLSYHFKNEPEGEAVSLNAATPKEWCTVNYNDLDHAVKRCIEESKQALEIIGSGVIFIGKTDLSNAFRLLPLKVCCFCWLVLVAGDPGTGKWKFFVDKCLPFGTSISCSHYQHFSNSLRHIIEVKTKRKTITNYLDDFLFVAMFQWLCNSMIQQFIDLCSELNIPVAIEKTEWASHFTIFLGILLDGRNLMLSIPLEKQEKALRLLKDLSGKRKIMVKNLQVLTGYLNFLT